MSLTDSLNEQNIAIYRHQHCRMTFNWDCAHGKFCLKFSIQTLFDVKNRCIHDFCFCLPHPSFSCLLSFYLASLTMARLNAIHISLFCFSVSCIEARNMLQNRGTLNIWISICLMFRVWRRMFLTMVLLIELLITDFVVPCLACLCNKMLVL